MYRIPIDDWQYHTNMLPEETKAWGLSVYERTVRRDKDVFAFTEKALAPLKLQKPRRRELLTDIILAFCHAMQDRYLPKSEAHMDKTVQKMLRIYLPYIVENLCVRQSSHPVQYEPITVACLYISRAMREALVSHINSSDEEPADSYPKLEFNNALRALDSAVLLLTVGDDVHGVSLTRGALEIWAKLIMAKEFPEEYILFKDFFSWLEYYRLEGEPLPPRMTDYLAKHPEAKKNLDNFLAYGWAKNKRGGRILTTSELMREAFASNNSPFKWMNSFVHENYTAVGYDYPDMRKKLLEFYFLIYDTVFQEDFIRPLLTEKEQHAIRTLIKSTYALCKTTFLPDVFKDKNTAAVCGEE